MVAGRCEGRVWGSAHRVQEPAVPRWVQSRQLREYSVCRPPAGVTRKTLREKRENRRSEILGFLGSRRQLFPCTPQQERSMRIALSHAGSLNSWTQLWLIAG